MIQYQSTLHMLGSLWELVLMMVFFFDVDGFFFTHGQYDPNDPNDLNDPMCPCFAVLTSCKKTCRDKCGGQQQRAVHRGRIQHNGEEEVEMVVTVKDGVGGTGENKRIVPPSSVAEVLNNGSADDGELSAKEIMNWSNSGAGGKEVASL